MIAAILLAFTSSGFFSYPSSIDNPLSFGVVPNGTDAAIIRDHAGIHRFSRYYYDAGTALLESLFERRLFGEICTTNAEIIAQIASGRFEETNGVRHAMFSTDAFKYLEYRTFAGNPWDEGGESCFCRDYAWCPGNPPPDTPWFYQWLREPVIRLLKAPPTLSLPTSAEGDMNGKMYANIFTRLFRVKGGFKDLIETGVFERQMDNVRDLGQVEWAGFFPVDSKHSPFTGAISAGDGSFLYWGEEIVDEFLEPLTLDHAFFGWSEAEPGLTEEVLIGLESRSPIRKVGARTRVLDRWLDASEVMRSAGQAVRNEYFSRMNSARNYFPGEIRSNHGRYDIFSAFAWGVDGSLPEADPCLFVADQDRFRWKPWLIGNHMADAMTRTFANDRLCMRPLFRHETASLTISVAVDLEFGFGRTFFEYQTDYYDHAHLENGTPEDLDISFDISSVSVYQYQRGSGPAGNSESIRMSAKGDGQMVGELEFNAASPQDEPHEYYVGMASYDEHDTPWGGPGKPGLAVQEEPGHYEYTVSTGVIQDRVVWSATNKTIEDHPGIKNASGEYVKLDVGEFAEGYTADHLSFTVPVVLNVDFDFEYPAELYDYDSGTFRSERFKYPCFPACEGRISGIRFNYLLASLANIGGTNAARVAKFGIFGGSESYETYSGLNAAALDAHRAALNRIAGDGSGEGADFGNLLYGKSLNLRTVLVDFNRDDLALQTKQIIRTNLADICDKIKTGLEDSSWKSFRIGVYPYVGYDTITVSLDVVPGAAGNVIENVTFGKSDIDPSRNPWEDGVPACLSCYIDEDYTTCELDYGNYTWNDYDTPSKNWGFRDWTLTVDTFGVEDVQWNWKCQPTVSSQTNRLSQIKGESNQ